MSSDKLVCFNCLGNVTRDLTFHPNGVLASKELRRVLQFNATESTSVERFKIFNFEFVDHNEFLSKIEILFNIARQKFRRLERCIYKLETDLNVESSEYYYSLRLDVCNFFNCLSYCIERIILQKDESLKQNSLAMVFAQLKAFIICIGQLSDSSDHVILNMASSMGNNCQTITYHYLHLHLDIRWYILKILLTLNDSAGMHILRKISLADVCSIKFILHQNDKSVTLENEYVQLLLWDLVNVAVKKFNKVTQEEYDRITPFTCSCVAELWVLVIHTLDRKKNCGKELKDDFWIVLHNIFQAIHLLLDGLTLNDNNNKIMVETDSVHFNLLPDFSSTNRLGFCWWILLHIAPLYQIDSLGQLSSQTQQSSNYFEVVHLTKLTLSTENYTCSESQLRCFLKCCVSVCQLLEPSIEIAILLWEYFYKRINETFMEEWEYAIQFEYRKSGLHWLEHVKSITGEDVGSPITLNSYQIFLRLLSVQLKKSRQIGSTKEWKQLKGRVFAKFHPRKMLELNKVGLHNCFSLFLTLASLADLDDMVLEIVKLLELMDPTLVELEKCGVLWKAMFALMLICEEQQHDLSTPAKKLASDFDCLARKISDNPSNFMNHHMASELLNIYLEGLKELFEHSANLNLSEYILIASEFSELLSRSSISDLELALSVVQVILARQRGMLKKKFFVENGSGETGGGSVEKEHYDALADALWSYVFPLLKEQVIGQVPYDIVAGVATGFTILTLDRPVKPSCPLKETFKSLLECFGFGLQNVAELCCQYLVNLLSQNSFLEKMESQMSDFQPQVIRTWFRIGLEMPVQSSSYQDLTRLVLGLPEVLNLYRGAELIIPAFSFQSDPLVDFLKTLGLWHANITTHFAIFAARHKVGIYLADVMKVSNAVLAKSNLHHEVSRVYHIMGNIVYHLSSLIYVKGKSDCLLNAILQDLVLPPEIYNVNKVIRTTVLTALKDNLQLFVEGIGKLGFRKDPYIKRTLKDVFIHYLPRYPLKFTEMPGTPMHPIVVILLNILRVHVFGLDIFLFALEEIRNHYLVQSGTAIATETAKNLEMGLDFMREILLRCSLQDKTAVRSILLVSLLKLLLLLDHTSLRQQATDLIKMLVSIENLEPNNSKSPLEVNLEEIIKQHFTTYSERVFKLLASLAKVYPSTIKNLLPVLTNQITTNEQKTGGGHDDLLRAKYRHFLMQIQVCIKQKV